MTIQVVHPDSPRGKFDAAMTASKEIMDRAKAADRAMSANELAEVGKHLDIAEAQKPQIEASNRAKRMVGVLADGGEPQYHGGAHGTGGDFKSRTARAWAEKAGEDLKQIAASRGGGVGTPQGLKALLGGTLTLGSLLTDPVVQPRLATNVLELLPKVFDTAAPGDEDGRNQFGHLVEGSTTNSAASSADGTVKPTTALTFTEKNDRYRVVATLSEAFPERYLEDYSKLVQILQVRLAELVLDEVERLVLKGDDTVASPKDEWDGLLNTVGVQTSANAGNLLTTLTNARGALLSLGHQPNALVLHPSDLTRYTNMREGGTTGALMWPGGVEQLAAWLGVEVVVPSTGLTAATGGAVGVAWIGDFNQARLRVRQDIQAKLIQPSDLAERNQFKARLEGRFGFQVDRPAAFVKISTDLTAIV
jgi:HK97 family phage major capsid protein